MARRHRHGGEEEEAEINMTPMLDMVFILLIFFIVTTSFVHPTGISVSRPSNAPTQTKKQNKVILIQIGNNGSITMDGRTVDPSAVEANVEREMATKPNATVVVVSGKQSHAGNLVTVIDQARRAGAKKVSIASTHS
jgi:biopolymer transport protein ExbD